MAVEDRLNRIEEKLDKLADAVVQLARMEERMVSLFNRIDYYEARQVAIEDKVEGIEKSVLHSETRVKFAERVFWIVVTAAVAATFWIFKE